MRFSNGLSNAEAERLAILAEECGEVVQVIGKILRHGMGSHHPVSGESNRELLTKELGDLAFAMDMVVKADLNMGQIMQAKDAKRDRIAQFLHHQ